MGREYGVLQMSTNFSLGSLLLAVDNNDVCPKLWMWWRSQNYETKVFDIVYVKLFIICPPISGNEKLLKLK
jgi:hypothetical protein